MKKQDKKAQKICRQDQKKKQRNKRKNEKLLEV